MLLSYFALFVLGSNEANFVEGLALIPRSTWGMIDAFPVSATGMHRNEPVRDGALPLSSDKSIA